MSQIKFEGLPFNRSLDIAFKMIEYRQMDIPKTLPKNASSPDIKKFKGNF